MEGRSRLNKRPSLHSHDTRSIPKELRQTQPNNPRRKQRKQNNPNQRTDPESHQKGRTTFRPTQRRDGLDGLLRRKATSHQHDASRERPPSRRNRKRDNRCSSKRLKDSNEAPLHHSEGTRGETARKGAKAGIQSPESELQQPVAPNNKTCKAKIQSAPNIALHEKEIRDTSRTNPIHRHEPKPLGNLHGKQTNARTYARHLLAPIKHRANRRVRDTPKTETNPNGRKSTNVKDPGPREQRAEGTNPTTHEATHTEPSKQNMNETGVRGACRASAHGERRLHGRFLPPNLPLRNGGHRQASNGARYQDITPRQFFLKHFWRVSKLLAIIND